MILLESQFNNIITEALQSESGKKRFYLKGIFMESEVENRNGRTYQFPEMQNAVTKINSAASAGRHILGELDHPGSLEIKLENVSHRILDMRMEGNNAIGRAEIIEEVPKGQIAKGLLEAGVQLGVSSRGTGSVEESTGRVSQFELVTVDLVSTPSAHGAYPQSIQESLLLYRKGYVIEDLAEAVIHDEKAQKYFEKELLKFIKERFNK